MNPPHAASEIRSGAECQSPAVSGKAAMQDARRDESRRTKGQLQRLEARRVFSGGAGNGGGASVVNTGWANPLP